MTRSETNTFDTVMVYLHSLQINFDDFGYDRICEVAEDYATGEGEFTPENLKRVSGHRLIGVCNI